MSRKRGSGAGCDASRGARPDYLGGSTAGRARAGRWIAPLQPGRRSADGIERIEPRLRTVVGRLGKAQPTCATRAGCAAKDCEGPTDVAGIATVRRAGTRCGRVISRMGPSPGIEGVGRPTLLYRFGCDKNFARRESWDAIAASVGSCQKCKPSRRPVKSGRHNLPTCEPNCKAKAGMTPPRRGFVIRYPCAMRIPSLAESSHQAEEKAGTASKSPASTGQCRARAGGLPALGRRDDPGAPS